MNDGTYPPPARLKAECLATFRAREGGAETRNAGAVLLLLGMIDIAERRLIKPGKRWIVRPMFSAVPWIPSRMIRSSSSTFEASYTRCSAPGKKRSPICPQRFPSQICPCPRPTSKWLTIIRVYMCQSVGEEPHDYSSSFSRCRFSDRRRFAFGGYTDNRYGA